MRWRVVLGALVIFVAVVVGAWASRSPLTERPEMQTGWVRMSSSEDGLTTVVTVAAHPPTAEGVDVVERAFRLQHLQPQHLTYEGPASVTHVPNQLMVSVGDGHGWRFPVAGRPVMAGSVPASYVEVPVRGLSQHWGASVHRPHDEIVAALLAGGCPLAGGSSNCESCQAGGAGAPSCKVQCGDDGCSAECNAGWSACCNCPGICSCCPDQPNAAAKKLTVAAKYVSGFDATTNARCARTPRRGWWQTNDVGLK